MAVKQHQVKSPVEIYTKPFVWGISSAYACGRNDGGKV